ncbi:MAG TPA: glycosyltransferase family A protein [Acidobacteriaceae bacterium]
MIPKVSVVIPTYNRAEKVGKGIDSVLAQSFPDFEVIVVDDGSSDDTGSILREAYGDRIRYFCQPNQGASIARNRGVEEARGEWVAFLDSDDLWERDKLEWQLRALDRFSWRSQACYTDVRFFNHSETRTMFEAASSSYRHEGEMGINTEALRLLVRPGGAGMVICLSSFISRRDLLRKVGGFNPSILYSQDSEFMFRLAMQTGFCYVNRPLVGFDRAPVDSRHVGVSADWNKVDFFLQDSQLRLEGLMRLAADLSPAIRSVIRRQLASTHSGWVNYYLETGQHARARAAASKALSMNPGINVAAKWLLTWLAPGVALRTVRQRESRRASEFTV